VISLATNFLYFTFLWEKIWNFFSFHCLKKRKIPAKNSLSQSQNFKTKKKKKQNE